MGLISIQLSGAGSYEELQGSTEFKSFIKKCFEKSIRVEELLKHEFLQDAYKYKNEFEQNFTSQKKCLIF